MTKCLDCEMNETKPSEQIGMLDELKTCPFCNGVAELKFGNGEYWVLCSCCKASAEMCNNRLNAIFYWNTRTEQKLKAQILEMIDKRIARLQEEWNDIFSCQRIDELSELKQKVEGL